MASHVLHELEGSSTLPDVLSFEILPVFPTTSPSHQETYTSLLASSFRGQTEEARRTTGKITGEGCYSLPQGIFPTQGSNPGFPHCRQVLYCLSHQGISSHYGVSSNSQIAKNSHTQALPQEILIYLTTYRARPGTVNKQTLIDEQTP